MDHLRFVTVDVFTEQTFGGNPLAVFFAAQDLSDWQMQRIAAEMNYSETTFVLPPTDPANTANVRIFTPVNELPFAGHPNVGTAYVLAKYPAAVPVTGTVQTLANSQDGQTGTGMCFEEKAGLVHVQVNVEAGVHRASIVAPQRFQQRQGHSLDAMAQALNLRTDQLHSANDETTIAGVGIEFPLVQVRDLQALQQCSANIEQFKRLSLDPQIRGEDASLADAFLIYAFCRTGTSSVSARMFDPMHGIPEDPATGSAAGALAGLLATQDHVQGAARYEIYQGEEMGRPSRILVDVVRDKGQIQQTQIAGDCVEVIQGTFALA